MPTRWIIPPEKVRIFFRFTSDSPTSSSSSSARSGTSFRSIPFRAAR